LISRIKNFPKNNFPDFIYLPIVPLYKLYSEANSTWFL
jgi:hypothetical protein